LQPFDPFFQPLDRSRRTGTSIARHVIAESVEVHDITSYTFYCLSYFWARLLSCLVWTNHEPHDFMPCSSFLFMEQDANTT
jgi:hypothetical protein